MTTPMQVDPEVAALFSDLAITPDEEAMPTARRGGAQARPNPFTEPVKASVATGRPYTIFIDPKGVRRANYLINAAARKQDLGVTVWIDVVRDKNGKVVPGKDGKAQYVVQGDGPNKGKVRVRFSGKAERKQQGNAAERAYSLITERKEGKPTGVFHVRDRASKVNVFTTRDKKAAQERYELLTNGAKVAEAQARAQAIIDGLSNGPSEASA